MAISQKIRRRGFEAERELVRRLWKHGIVAIRAPASGAKAKKIFYPDVVALYKGTIMVFEVKSREKPSPIRIEKEKIEKLLFFAEKAGGKAYIAIKIRSNHQWLILSISKIDLAELLNSEKKYLNISENTIKEKGIALTQFINMVKNKELDIYMQNYSSKTASEQPEPL